MTLSAFLFGIGIKKNEFFLFCPRFFRNFGFAEVTMHSEMQKKSELSFCISLVFS